MPSRWLTSALTKESGRYSTWVSSPRCWSRKEPKDKTAGSLVSSVGKPVACDCISQWLLGYPALQLQNHSSAPLSSPLASSSYPSWRGRRATEHPLLSCPPGSSSLSHSALSMGLKGENNWGLFQPACSRQREKTGCGSLAGLGASSVGMTRLSATVEESVPCAYFLGVDSQRAVS